MMQIRMFLGMLRLAAVAGVVAVSAVESGWAGDAVDFRGGWKFSKGDHDGAEAAEFDDSAWDDVRLPHDWAIAGPFAPAEPSGFAAKLPWKGVGWYRKEFKLDRAEGDRVYLDFDGVMAFPQVYVNGKLAGDWDYGYTSFRVDATPFVNLNGANVVSVRVDTTNHGTRWYPGAGIYRKVMMELCRPVHLAQWGVYVTTPEVSAAEATVAVDARVENHGDAAAEAEIEFIVLGPDGQERAKRTFAATVPPGEKQIGHSFEIEKPELWEIGASKMYTLRTIVTLDGEVVDQRDEPFGIRSFELTADDGFHLNGRRVQLYGVCLHHDHGPLGGAFYPRAMERQLEIMREMGVNAIRTSHNAPAPELLEMCDRMGLFVWDECFDKWNETADRVRDKPSHEQHAERHLRSLVMRDRNHPSVFVWSIGNEIPAGGQGVSAERVKMMRDVVLKYDATRPVGMACHIEQQASTNILDALDFMGWNYARRYANYRAHYPNKAILYSESASALSTRGFYELPLPTTKTDYSEQHQVDSYDFNAAPWSDIADIEFKLMEDDSFVAGEFVWTGFDYLGEPTPFDAEAKSSYFGIVDLCGIPKDRYYLYRSYWRPDVSTVHIVPHWNWPDREGQNVPVWVYANGDSAELFLNGKSLGRRTKGDAQRPQTPENFAKGRPVTASSTQPGNQPAMTVDGNVNTRWCATSDATPQWMQVDLGKVQPVKYLVIEFEREAKNYGYTIKTSQDQKTWETALVQKSSIHPEFGGPRSALSGVDVEARYVRIEFDNLRDGCWASIREFGVYPDKIESDYYAPTYRYRLRWNDVVYEPGELKAVAYQGDKKIGETIVRTAGDPASIRLSPDRTKLDASGDDLCYVTVEAFDAEGVPCRLADNMIHFKIDGPGEIAGVGNGNPLSYEPYQADHRQLFYGKAMLIVRTKAGEAGKISITASGEGLKDGTVTVESVSP